MTQRMGLGWRWGGAGSCVLSPPQRQGGLPSRGEGWGGGRVWGREGLWSQQEPALVPPPCPRPQVTDNGFASL